MSQSLTMASNLEQVGIGIAIAIALKPIRSPLPRARGTPWESAAGQTPPPRPKVLGLAAAGLP